MRMLCRLSIDDGREGGGAWVESSNMLGRDGERPAPPQLMYDEGQQREDHKRQGY